MRPLFYVLFVAAQLWVVAAVVRAILSWFPIDYGSPAHKANSVLVRVTEPLIAPVRRIMPTVSAGGVGIDLSFMVVILVMQFFVIPLLARHAF
jgi:YggT family protein